MKKILISFFVTLISLISIFYLTACSNTTNSTYDNISDAVADIVAPLKLYDTRNCTSTTVDASITTYLITPSGFDLEELNERGYIMTIKVSYDVYYTKDWDVLWDIGYLGAPKYEVCILDDDLVGKIDENVTAPSKSTTRTLSYTVDVVNLIGSKVYLTFSSDNIQNKIHFKNINITYTCYK